MVRSHQAMLLISRPAGVLANHRTDPKVLKEGALAGHWGLPGIRERAKQIGALLDFWSKAGAGTEVELTVPASVAYAKSPDGFGTDRRGFGLFRKKRSHRQRS